MDDAFYVFSVSKHLAAGLGMTVDGMHLTNGFQPLLVLLYTPLFWLGGSNPWLAVRYSFLLNGFIAGLAVWAVAILLRTMERAPDRANFSAPIIGAAIWAFAYSIFAQMTNGLETGLASLLLLVALIVYAKEDLDAKEDSDRFRKIGNSQGWLLGLVLGFAVLARIDAAIFVAIIVFLQFWKKRIRAAIVTGAVALLVSSPWWIFNWIHFGSLMPISGQAENIWPLPPHENIYRATQAISNILSLIVYLPDSLSFLLRILWLLALLAGIFLFLKRTTVAGKVRTAFRTDMLLPLLLFSIVLFFYYTFFFRAPHFLERYFQPARMLWSLLVAAGVAVLWREKIARKLIVIAIVAGLIFSIDRFATNYSFGSHQADFYDMGVWANAHPKEKIGMLQSGIASFVAPNVINLDGKVNAAALHAHQQGRLAEYLRVERFTYIADWKPFVEDLAKIARTDKLYFDSTGMIDHIQLMKRRENPHSN